ncbi:MAG: hypothetical protein O9272_15610 [Brevundimonas sp.]|jgi:protein ImuA|nr:hypothetical protein [Brevundimonas sp.]
MRVDSSLSAPVPPVCERRWASGVAALDAVLGGGLAYGCLHEVYAAEAQDCAAAAGFAAALAAGMAQDDGGSGQTVLWLRAHRAVEIGGVLQAGGLGELGLKPEQAVLGLVADRLLLLRSAVDALRSAALGALIVEGWGPMPELDLTASRRLVLAARQSGVPLFLLRIDAAPVPSAAQTRWQVAAAASLPLPGEAPGPPAFAVELLRQKAGPCGQAWRLEWDRDRHKFDEATLSGAALPVPRSRPAAERGTGALRPDRTRHAA